ncbi:hypothetical protein EB169_03485 [archaeon]|nr:hypothetical protein [archaeon]NDB54873.1 hypothetical protein [archaeon]
MILFINTFITDKVLPGSQVQDHRKWNREFLNNYSSLTIFKYSLASLSPIHNWTKVILKISLDSDYIDQKDELEKFIKKEFYNTVLDISWKRNELQSEWQETYHSLDDELIWFSCNHDHICLDSNSDYLNYIVSKMELDQDQPISSYFTHWPENVAHVSKSYNPKNLTIFEDYATMNQETCDSINIISKQLYKKWWFSVQFPNDWRFPRPDWMWNMLSNYVKVPNQKQFIQFKEQARHFDAYYHMTRNQCPALNIPEGFFEDKIKISIGNSVKIDGYVWLNPLIKDFSSESTNGVDYKMLEEDIPLFWKRRTIEIKKEKFDKDEFIEGRLKSVLNMINVNYTTPHIFDADVKQKILDVWKRSYTISK